MAGEGGAPRAPSFRDMNLDPPPSFSPFLSAPDPRAKASDLPLCVFFDGASGAVVYHYGEEIASFTTTTPFATSNQVQFIAGIDALNLATYFCPRNIRSLLVFGDSEIIKGLQNNSPPKNPLLFPLHLRLKALVDYYKQDH